MQNGTNAAIYCRLSRDEDAGQESNSIASQRLMLSDFVRRQGFTLVNEYVDDGYSGTNYDRPDFRRMISDAEQGKIDVIITKDLSRLGRDYLTTGEYMEKIFPRLNLRYIAMNDGYDSADLADGNADFAPIRNYFNEWYAKDCSRKTRASFKAMAQAGKFIASKAPYGYCKDPDDKHHLLVDAEAAEVVRMIFDWAAGGQGYKAIANRLRAAGIQNPNAYANRVDPTFHQSNYWRQAHDWHPSSIKTILTNPTYLGHVVNGRRQVKSFKCKEIVKNAPEDWIVVENMHEAIIAQRTWDSAQAQLARCKRSGHNGTIQIFAGLLKCADCGYSMAYRSNPSPSYRCSLNNVKGKGYCTGHYISYNALHQVVLEDIRRKAHAARRFKAMFTEHLTKQTSGIVQEKIRAAQEEIRHVTSRKEELEQIISKLYEDHALGRLPFERYQNFMDKYETEQRQTEDRLRQANEVLAEIEGKRESAEQFTKVIRQYCLVEELTAPILNELVERIEIGEKRIIDGQKQQFIRIIYRHVGFVGDYVPELLLKDDLRHELHAEQEERIKREFGL